MSRILLLGSILPHKVIFSANVVPHVVNRDTRTHTNGSKFNLGMSNLGNGTLNVRGLEMRVVFPTFNDIINVAKE